MSERKIRPLIVPIFIPNQGCPHRCIFCDQEKITSQSHRRVNAEYVEKVLDTAVHSKSFDLKRDPEIAFYGGTFTMLSTGRIKELLEAAAPYIRKRFFRSVRVSTRPDALDQDRLNVMKDRGVLTVELGAQSMDDRVLSLSQRGHSAEDTVSAVHILRRNGFRVGLQLMPGLPGDTKDTFRSTITQVVKLRPDMVRLYPAVVIQGTELARRHAQGRYQPLTLENAVDICMESCIRLESEGIPVIRIGLMSSPSLLENGRIVAGPWHTAFGFLVRSGIHLKKIEPDLPGQGKALQIIIHAPKMEIPMVRGYKNQGLKWIEAKTGARVITVKSDDTIPQGKIRVEKI